MDKTKIDWCDSTWNPVTGCLHGCEYCYARNIAHRFSYSGETLDAPAELQRVWIEDSKGCGTGNRVLRYPVETNDGKKVPYPFEFAPTFHKYRLNDYAAKKGRNIFVCSMADLFGDWVLDEWMDGMKEFPDKYFDLAVVDPVYGDVKAGGYMTGKSMGGAGPHPDYNYSIWNQPKTDKVYFDELFRVSKNQIIFGGNYFAEAIGRNSTCWIVWDKCNDGPNFADCELAWTSFDTAVRIFRFMWNGMLQGKSIHDGTVAQGNKALNEKRIHPTQKPVALYDWIFSKYAEPGQKILDTHVGSASSLISAKKNGLQFVGFELDPHYYRESLKRYNEETAQMTLFDFIKR